MTPLYLDIDDDIDDGPKRCPNCEQPNQFGELCDQCRRDLEQAAYDAVPRLDEPHWRHR